MRSPTLADVWLWEQRVGTVAEHENGRLWFEYDEAFRHSGLEVSPLHLPLSLSGPLEFPALATSKDFQGLPGLLSDALPDRFGSAAIWRHFAAMGTPRSALRPIQRLRYVGARTMGALRVRPGLSYERTPQDDAILATTDLVADARRTSNHLLDLPRPELARLSASPGGARPRRSFSGTRGEANPLGVRASAARR